MKSISILIFLSFIYLKTFSQDTIFIYYNNDWKETTKDSAFNHRKAYSTDTNKWVALDYYDNGKLKMKIEFKDRKMSVKNGKYIIYYENGNMMCKGEYSNNNKDGSWTIYYENGNIKDKEEYTFGDKNGNWVSYYENGNVSSKKSYINNKLDGTYTEYFENGRIANNCIYSNGVQISSTLYYDTGEKCMEGKFEKGKETEEIFWDEKGNKIKDTEAQTMPDYPGGTNALMKYLKYNIEYPTLARETCIQGTVYIQFIVEKDGSISVPKILRGIGGGCDEEAIRVVGNMPNWTPGVQCKRKVPVHFQLPIKFTLKN